jgi:hypothetical protein
MLGTSTRIWPDNYGADMSRTAERLVPPLPLPVDDAARCCIPCKRQQPDGRRPP